jgi:hypothetical protein
MTLLPKIHWENYELQLSLLTISSNRLEIQPVMVITRPTSSVDKKALQQLISLQQFKNLLSLLSMLVKCTMRSVLTLTLERAGAGSK